MRNKELQKLIICAMFAAIGIVIEVLTTFVPGLNLEMPYGGRVFGFSMLPVILISFMLGIRYGLISGLLLGSVNILLSINMIATWSLTTEALIGTILLDYLIPYTILGLAGIFNNGMTKISDFILGTLLVCFLRYICHVISGVVIWYSFAGENDLWYYSAILYNLPYMASSTGITLAIGLLVRKPLISFYQSRYQQPSDNQSVD